MALKKIVIIGPESTGKSTLTTALAKHYDTFACPEYAREYLNTNGVKYDYSDLEKIAKGQLAEEDKLTQDAIQQNKQKLIVDTDMYVMKVWCEYVFNNCYPFILEAIEQRKYDLYLLCDIDLPWTKDEMREYPDEGPRKELFAIYKEILINQSTPWGIVSGMGETRLQNAITITDKILGK
jgi:NadR type nicotinamide-nucleotide adenylyltransferase